MRHQTCGRQRNEENWFMGYLQRPNGNRHGIDDDEFSKFWASDNSDLQ